MVGRGTRRALLLAAVLALIASGLVACGGGDSTSTIDTDADVEVLNEILGRQLAAVAAYERVLPSLDGADLAAAREFHAQEQEHVDATVKVLRGVGGEEDPPAETIEAKDLKTRADHLTFLYEMESATIDAELSAIGRLTLPWPRPLIATMAANQAERLVLIRRALGARPLEAVPSAFEDGTVAAP